MELLNFAISAVSMLLLLATVLVLVSAPFSTTTRKFMESTNFWVLLLTLNAVNALNSGLDIATGQSTEFDGYALTLSLVMLAAISIYLYLSKDRANQQKD